MIRLAPPETSSAEHIEATLDYLEAKQAAWMIEQDRRLARAEKRIKLCSLLRIGEIIFAGPSAIQKHYSWCPYEYWIGNNVLTTEDLG